MALSMFAPALPPLIFDRSLTTKQYKNRKNQRIEAPPLSAHANYSEAFVEDKSIAVFLFIESGMEMIGPVFFS